jgi:hypothetical protein
VEANRNAASQNHARRQPTFRDGATKHPHFLIATTPTVAKTQAIESKATWPILIATKFRSNAALLTRESELLNTFRDLYRSPSLIGTPKRLEIALNQTKQTSEVISNRDKIDPSSKHD